MVLYYIQDILAGAKIQNYIRSTVNSFLIIIDHKLFSRPCLIMTNTFRAKIWNHRIIKNYYAIVIVTVDEWIQAHLYIWFWLPGSGTNISCELIYLVIVLVKFDLKLCFKIINNLCGLDPANFFTFAPSTLTRGHEFKLIKSICRNNWLLNFYSNRVVNFWNSLPPDVVNARTFNVFVNKLNCIDVSRFCHIGRA